MKKYYLVTTQHLEDRLWFRDDPDFIAGMNLVAVQASVSEVVVLAFILMSNHVHFVLYGEYDEVCRFIRQLKGRYAQYFGRRWEVRNLLSRNGVDIQEIDASTPEALERAIAYVLMNCVAANICSHPGLYPWGSGSCYFSVRPGEPKKVASLSRRARGRLLHDYSEAIPEDWQLSEHGYVLPESYVAVPFVERLYRQPSRMDYFLRNSSKARKRLESAETHLPAFKDQTILAALPDLYRTLFQKRSFSDLSAEERPELLRQVRFRFSCDVNQLARVCGISYAEAAQLLDRI